MELVSDTEVGKRRGGDGDRGCKRLFEDLWVVLAGGAMKKGVRFTLACHDLLRVAGEDGLSVLGIDVQLLRPWTKVCCVSCQLMGGH